MAHAVAHERQYVGRRAFRKDRAEHEDRIAQGGGTPGRHRPRRLPEQQPEGGRKGSEHGHEMGQVFAALPVASHGLLDAVTIEDLSGKRGARREFADDLRQ